MCRASKVERLVIRYPEGEDPSTDFENTIQTRGIATPLVPRQSNLQ
jgi:hypothetical protein